MTISLSNTNAAQWNRALMHPDRTREEPNSRPNVNILRPLSPWASQGLIPSVILCRGYQSPGTRQAVWYSEATTTSQSTLIVSEGLSPQDSNGGWIKARERQDLRQQRALVSFGHGLTLQGLVCLSIILRRSLCSNSVQDNGWKISQSEAKIRLFHRWDNAFGIHQNFGRVLPEAWWSNAMRPLPPKL